MNFGESNSLGLPVGGTIDKTLLVKWNGKEYINYCQGIANPRKPRYFKGRRLLIREITNPSIYSAITEDELYNDPAVIIVMESNFSLETASISLNSKLGSFYHFNASPKATKGDFPKILVKDIKEFPITKNITTIDVNFFRLIYDLASFSIAAASRFYDSIFTIIVDALVFQLYFPDHMKDRNIDILQFVEKDLEEVMQGREFDQLIDIQKEKIISQLHARWTDPESEIVKRMNSFSEKSPEILKPILEG
jgi:adenine-specific DNA-methyltransferase